MNRWILLVLLVVSISAAATVAVQVLPQGSSVEDGVKFPAPTNDGPRPKAVVEGETTYRFGTMPQKETGTKTWVIRNEGKAPLELWMISSTCMCTVAKLKDGKKDKVAPGKATEITLEWQTKEVDGKFSKGATIGTNDPELPQFMLAAEGLVRPAIQVYPEANVNFLTISDDEKDHVQHLAVFSLSRPDMKIEKITSSKPGLIVADTEPLTEDDCQKLECKKGYKLNVHVKAGMPLGIFREQLVLETDHPKQPKVELTVSGKTIGPINVTPDPVQWHNVSSSDGGTMQVTLSVRSRRPTKFEVAQKPRPLQIAVKPADTAGKSGVYRMTIAVPPGTPPATIEDWIILKTDNPDAAELKIPISVYIQAASG